MGRAEKQLEKDTDLVRIKEGIILVFNKLRAVLQHKGLKEMVVGQDEFDADLHEAITEIPAPDTSKVGKVIDVVEPGYYLNEKLIRHAKVVVGK
jgi:molecular chaperone GrpE